MKNIFKLSLMVLGLVAAPQLSFANETDANQVATEGSEGSTFSAADMSITPEEGADDPLLNRLKELVAKGKAQNMSNILVDTDIKEFKVLINKYGWSKLKADAILTRGEYKAILKKRSQEQRNLWRTLAPQDAMNDVRLSPKLRLNKCNYRSQADYFMNVEEDAITHRIGMAEIYSVNTTLESTRNTEVKALKALTNAEKKKSSNAYGANKKKCKAWVKEYDVWLKKYDADLKAGLRPNETQPLFVLDLR